MGNQVDDYNAYRQKMNDRLMSEENARVLKRIYGVDTLAYQAGELDVKTKEMLGLATSMVLRCDDCIRYHLIKCHEAGLTTAELMEIFGISNLVGGTIVIPHTRRALEFWDELTSNAK
ncbi:MAG: carboxymuconolactone decarboxylase family protein [Bacteroidales bacterium]|jgi:AhpD family alkylhydroperoxidase|nr:carboxymuconolactone decarboxylase family protein [Bacteroidales bacterium]